MELLAVIVGLESLKITWKVLEISDSKYVVHFSGEEMGFRLGEERFRRQKKFRITKPFLKVYRKHQADFKWIKGHNNHPQNERCDELAVYASGLPNYPLMLFMKMKKRSCYKTYQNFKPQTIFNF